MSPRSPRPRSSPPSTSAGRARERAAELRAADSRRRRRRSLIVQASVVAGVAVLVLGVTVAVLAGRDDGVLGPPPGMTESGAVLLGETDAPVTVTVVEDFQCPACRAFEAAAGDLLASLEQDPDVAVEYRGIAFLDRASTTRYSSRALNASACVVAADRPSWPAFHETLFAQQPPEGGAGLDDDTLLRLAAEAGADDPDVAACIGEERYADWVEDTTSTALGEDGIGGTPTVLVNGTVVPEPSVTALAEAVERAKAS